MPLLPHVSAKVTAPGSSVNGKSVPPGGSVILAMVSVAVVAVQSSMLSEPCGEVVPLGQAVCDVAAVVST